MPAVVVFQLLVSETIEELYPTKFEHLRPVKASGVKECKEVLERALNGTLDANFIEGMGCVGGCVGGPKTMIPKEQGKIAVDEFAYDSPIKVPLHSEILDELLEKLDITSISDFEDPDKISILERDF